LLLLEVLKTRETFLLDVNLRGRARDVIQIVHRVALPWADNNSRRIKAANGLWPAERGWWMHMEVPWQNPSWHWDCGALRRSEMLRMAQILLTQ
jgi:hypothetical protein